MTEVKTHRLHIIVEEEAWERWNRNVPWGLRQHLIKSVMATICNAVEGGDKMIIGALISNQYKLVPHETAKPGD